MRKLVYLHGAALIGLALLCAGCATAQTAPVSISVKPVEPQIGWPMDKYLSFFVGEYMPNGGHQEAADKVKYQLRVNSFRSAPLTELGGSAASDIVDNPFGGMADWEVFYGPEQRLDGSFALSYGGKNINYSQNTPPDVAVVFRVQEEAY